MPKVVEEVVVEVSTNGDGQEPKEEGNYWLNMTHKVLQAYIGAIALAQDEIEEFVHKLVERGEVAEKDARKLVKDVMEKSRKQVSMTEDDVSQRVEDALDRMGVPTKDDISALGDKIAELTKKVDELKKTKV
jgi:poly(hydroxyalkanoate) granule-associated protein